MPNDTGWGGKRKGAGGKSPYKAKGPRKQITIPLEYVKLVKRYVKEVDEKRYGEKEEAKESVPEDD